ncbi:Fc.00g049920.m01.CDS01 [Cosmosporella sp. VM-42]
MDNKQQSSSSDAAQLVKFEFHHNKREDVSYEDFVSFVKNEWLAAALPIIKRYGIVHYSMTFSDPKQRASLSEQVKAASMGSGVTVSDFDVVSTYYLPDHNSLFAMRADPEWQDKVAKIQEPWVSMETGLFVIGHETQYT